MAKATHRGHCQLCGSLQMLPSGRLSLHGYKVEHSYFSGICRGAKHLPFEQSFHLVIDEIKMATEALERVEKRIHGLENDIDDDTKMWVHTFVPSSGMTRSRHIWEPVTLTARPEQRDSSAHGGHYNVVKYSYVEHGGKETGDSRSGFHGVEAWDMPHATCEELRRATVLKYNRTYAKWYQHEATSLRRYIAWHKERMQNWTEKPLLPRDAKSKLEFVPTPAPY